MPYLHVLLGPYQLMVFTGLIEPLLILPEKSYNSIILIASVMN